MVTEGSLLTSGVRSVLRERPDIDLLTIEGRGQIYRRIRDAGPDVVIVDGDHEPRGLSVDRLLQENPRSTVVALSLDQPEMSVFRAQRVSRPTPDDLLRVLGRARKDAARAGYLGTGVVPTLEPKGLKRARAPKGGEQDEKQKVHEGFGSRRCSRRHRRGVHE